MVTKLAVVGRLFSVHFGTNFDLFLLTEHGNPVYPTIPPPAYVQKTVEAIRHR